MTEAAITADYGNTAFNVRSSLKATAYTKEQQLRDNSFVSSGRPYLIILSLYHCNHHQQNLSLVGILIKTSINVNPHLNPFLRCVTCSGGALFWYKQTHLHLSWFHDCTGWWQSVGLAWHSDPHFVWFFMGTLIHPFSLEYAITVSSLETVTTHFLMFGLVVWTEPWHRCSVT